MLDIVIDYKKEDRYVSQKITATIDDPDVIELVGRKFAALQAEGIITGQFTDNYWWVNNGSIPCGLSFEIEDTDIFEKYMAGRLCREKFIYFLKLYVVAIFDKTALDGIHDTLVGLIRNCNNTHYFDRLVAFKGSTGSQERLHLIKFLMSLPLDNEEFISDLKQKAINVNGRKYAAKELSDFMTYYVIDEELRQFWKSDLSDKDRLYYYPFYIYWILTTVLSIRVTEFCLTPYDCIEFNEKKGRYQLTYRVTKMKGSTNKKYVSHSMADYKIRKATITEEIASEILKYRNLRAKYGDDGFIFSSQAFADSNPYYVSKIRERFNRDHLTKLKNDFILKILVGEKKYKLLEKPVQDSCSMEEYVSEFRHTICDFQNRDTRHISAMSMILNGSSIQALTVMTNHMTAEMALHYAGNVEKFQKARLYMFYMKHRYGNVDEVSTNSLTSNYGDLQNSIKRAVNQYNNRDLVGIDMGDVICISKEKAEGRNTDCRKNVKLGEANPCLNCDWKRIKPYQRGLIKISSIEKCNLELKRIADMLPLKEGRSMADLERAVQAIQEAGKTLTVTLLEEQLYGKTA